MSNERLTKRELEAAIHAARGKTNKEIAKEMGISQYTVKQYMKIAFRVLGVQSRIGVAIWAAKGGLV